MVATGEIEVVTRHGARQQFAAGAMLPFAELPIVEVRNVNAQRPATLVVVRRPSPSPPESGRE